jgi:hypothetical protein
VVDWAFVDNDVRSGVDFIDSPVIGLSKLQETFWIISGPSLILADQDTTRIASVGGVNVFKRCAKIDIVSLSEVGGYPAQDHITRDIRSIGSRIHGRICTTAVPHKDLEVFHVHDAITPGKWTDITWGIVLAPMLSENHDVFVVDLAITVEVEDRIDGCLPGLPSSAA